jgi:hypothetical protein
VWCARPNQPAHSTTALQNVLPSLIPLFNVSTIPHIASTHDASFLHGWHVRYAIASYRTMRHCLGTAMVP